MKKVTIRQWTVAVQRLKWIAFLWFLNCPLLSDAQEVPISLNDGWRFKQVGTNAWYEAEVPGLVHTDLMRHDLIPDPYRDTNVDSVQWVENEDWIYQRTLFVDDQLLAKENIDLVFEGLDTFAEVYLNGQRLGASDNMFRTWRWPVRNLLVPGRNMLEVLFNSAIREGAKRREAYGIQLPHDSDPSGVAPYIRKAAYHFGWDFAPRLVSCGIWRDVLLVGWDQHRLTHMHVQQEWEGEDLTVTASVSVLPALQRIGKADGPALRLVCLLNGEEVASQVIDDEILAHPSVQFKLNAPQRWWPRGSGPQPIHDLRIELRSDTLLNAITKRVGWRTVTLDQSSDSIGTAFTFIVNDLPIFMKGCNLVPPDMFLPRAGDSAWVDLVASMAEANMNMVRVWGGGVYPPDAFFDACDTAGIMVWQDLMFAYPTPYDELAQRSIGAELVDQLSRFGEHPCLALVCGNNELEVAWNNWGWQKRYGMSAVDSARIWEDQRALFHGPDLRLPVEEYYDLPYVATSPLSNWGGTEGLRHGSLHYWGVWHADSSFSSYRNNVGRFVSEYGFQSWPDSSVLARYMEPSTLVMGSDALRRRQGSYRGEAPIQLAMQRELGMVPNSFADYCAGSQLLQAKAYAEAIGAHFRARPQCMGTLLWQLNDVWPAPSWSIIDHGGNRKPAYFRVRDLYAPLPDQ